MADVVGVPSNVANVMSAIAGQDGWIVPGKRPQMDRREVKGVTANPRGDRRLPVYSGTAKVTLDGVLLSRPSLQSAYKAVDLAQNLKHETYKAPDCSVLGRLAMSRVEDVPDFVSGANSPAPNWRQHVPWEPSFDRVRFPRGFRRRDLADQRRSVRRCAPHPLGSCRNGFVWEARDASIPAGWQGNATALAAAVPPMGPLSHRLGRRPRCELLDLRVEL